MANNNPSAYIERLKNVTNAPLWQKRLYHPALGEDGANAIIRVDSLKVDWALWVGLLAVAIGGSSDLT